MKNVILHGNCLEVLKDLPDNHVDSIVTDVPYGLGTKEPTVEEIIAYLQGEDLDTGGDFMGHSWSVPSVGVWEECYRVLKPGGHVLSFAGSRTFDLISIGLRSAGFQSRDTIATQFGVQVFQWIQGQGFPRSNNLKPSWEPVLVFRKPGASAYNIDASRIGGVRWPPNVAFVHSEECRKVGSERVKAPVINRFDDGMKPFGGGAGHKFRSIQTGDEEGMEEVPVFECGTGCPAKELEKQKSGASKFFGQFLPGSSFVYCAKASKKERKLENDFNNHPTVKPLDLMAWLVKLVTPVGGTVLDPYCGSGTTCVAAMQNGCSYIGIEMDEGFHEIATKRLEVLSKSDPENIPKADQMLAFDMLEGLLQDG